MEILKHEIFYCCCYLFINKTKESHQNIIEEQNNDSKYFSTFKTCSKVLPTTKINENYVRKQSYNDNILLSSNKKTISTFLTFFFFKKNVT